MIARDTSYILYNYSFINSDQKSGRLLEIVNYLKFAPLLYLKEFEKRKGMKDGKMEKKIKRWHVN